MILTIVSRKHISILDNKNFNKYLDGEIEKGNIDKEIKTTFLKNLDELPTYVNEAGKSVDSVSGMKNINMFMGTYLAQIIARHEWTKGIIGNDYLLRGDSQDEIFNRMRQPASEGIVDRNGSDKVQLVINEKNVYYRNTETREKIDIEQKVKGIKNKVAIDDGQMDIDSDTMNEYARSVGRNKVSDFEHDPKEIKIRFFDTAKAKGKPKTPEQLAKKKKEVEQLNQDIIDLIQIEREYDTLEEAKAKIDRFINE